MNPEDELTQLALLSKQLVEDLQNDMEKIDEEEKKFVEDGFVHLDKMIEGPRNTLLSFEEVCCITAILVLPFLLPAEDDDGEEEHEESTTFESKSKELFELSKNSLTPIEQVRFLVSKCKQYAIDARKPVVSLQASILIKVLLRA